MSFQSDSQWRTAHFANLRNLCLALVGLSVGRLVWLIVFSVVCRHWHTVCLSVCFVPCLECQSFPSLISRSNCVRILPLADAVVCSRGAQLARQPFACLDLFAIKCRGSAVDQQKSSHSNNPAHSNRFTVTRKWITTATTSSVPGSVYGRPITGDDLSIATATDRPVKKGNFFI